MFSLDDAIDIAVRAHKGQKDKSGKPYILHPLFIMSKMKTEEEMIIAVLHDVFEDGPSHIQKELKAKLLDQIDIFNSLIALTRKKDEDYQDFILRVSKDRLAVKVKIADIEHNMDLSRLQFIKARDITRYMKYRQSLNFLQNLK